MSDKSRAGWLIETRQLTKTYGRGATMVFALNEVCLTVAPGEFLAVMGPSGCGKSTLLNMLGALDQPTRGQVVIADQDLAHLHNVDAFRAEMVGFVFQLHNLLPTLTALENVEVPMQARGTGAGRRRARAQELLEVVGIADRAHYTPGQLSGGQRQRVAVARALANQPRLILADEPTGSLDSQSGEEILSLLQELNRTQGTTIVVVTHDRRVAQATNRIVHMRDGRIVEDHRVADPLEEDLRLFATTALGQAILYDEQVTLAQITPEEAAVLRRMFYRLGITGAALPAISADTPPDRSTAQSGGAAPA